MPEGSASLAQAAKSTPDGSFNELAAEIAAVMISKGFPTPTDLGDPELVMSKLMLVVTELGEATEAIRKPPPDVENFYEEIADAMIRLLHLCGGLNIDIDGEIAKKMAKNRERPYLHGKRA